MAEQCIVCEASLQPYQDHLLCDGCRKPAETPTALDNETAVAESVAETPLRPEYAQRFRGTIQIVEGGSIRWRRKLIF